ncbi:MAG: ribosome silencing factor [Planctomycetota bacterium]|nr:ribosome silencing factor [Planctomycetota bacterium]
MFVGKGLPGTIMLNGREIAILAARLAEGKKAENIVVYDVRGAMDLTDYLVIATVHSRHQARAVADAVRRETARHGCRPLGVEGYPDSQWILLDYVDAIVHLFSPDLRAYYSLETMWGDAPKVDFSGAETV